MFNGKKSAGLRDLKNVRGPSASGVNGSISTEPNTWNRKKRLIDACIPFEQVSGKKFPQASHAHDFLKQVSQARGGGQSPRLPGVKDKNVHSGEYPIAFRGTAQLPCHHCARMLPMRKVAIFDIDGTIFRSSLLIQIVERMIEEKIFSTGMAQSFARQKFAWLDRKGDYDAYIMAVVKVFRENVKGLPYHEFNRIGREVVAEQKDRVYRYTRDLITELKKKGYFLLAVSHSPKGVLDHFCKRLGFDKVYGLVYEIGPSDRFTGEVADEHLMMNKALVVKRAVEREELTLKGSIGVGDTESDISFLELVSEPICFNPNAKLYAHAKRNKWKVVVERKDVVYEM